MLEELDRLNDVELLDTDVLEELVELEDTEVLDELLEDA